MTKQNKKHPNDKQQTKAEKIEKDGENLPSHRQCLFYGQRSKECNPGKRLQMFFVEFSFRSNVITDDHLAIR